MTATLLEALSRTAYPGRGILLGRSPDGRMLAAAYFITGRSASSQARVLVREEETVWTRPSDPEVLKKGDPELLIYPALILSGGLAVSNGRQTADVAALVASGLSPREILALALEHWDYEPDGPIFTPRISGCATPDGRAALGLVYRSEDGSSVRQFFDVPPEPGRAVLLTTYAEGDAVSVRSAEGPPADLLLGSATAEDLAEAVYGALAPREKGPDYRVAVAALMTGFDFPGTGDIRIINRRERKTDDES